MNAKVSTKKGLRTRGRAAAVGAVCAAMLAGGAGAAIAAPATLPTVHPTTVAAATPTPTKTASITAHAKPTSVKAGGSVVISGKTMDIKTGSRLGVRHLNSNGKWTPLHASATVRHGGVYAVHVKLHHKGEQQLRVTHGKTMSPIVRVHVT